MKWLLEYVQDLRFDSIRGMLTVPGIISLCGLVLAAALLWVDSNYEINPYSYLGFNLEIEADTARALISTVASASMTTLSLVYSITLLVFTLAAGTVGPRLLQRFTGDRINQITAGLLGATFIFAVITLHRISDTFIPVVSITIIMLMAIVAVVLLIVFVHSVARRVTIDEEVALISWQLNQEFERLVAEEKANEEKDRKPRPTGIPTEIKATKSGYIDQFFEQELIDLACKHDVYIEFDVRPGSFIIEGLPLASIVGRVTDELEDEVRENVIVANVRRPTGDIEFSINLIVEIGLRALSPGINDTFTAIACVDRLSSAMSSAVRDGLREPLRRDDDGTPRLYVGDFDLEQLIDVAFNPLRRAARGNVLMASHIARALGRLMKVAADDAKEHLRKHIDLLQEETDRADLLDIDKRFVQSSFKDLRDAA